MVTKKNVFVMVLVFLMVAGIVSAGAIGRGGFGASAVLAQSATPTERPIQMWQSLDADDVASCPCIGEDGEFDEEAYAARQAERAAWRDQVQSNYMGGAMGRNSRVATPFGASYGPNRAPVQGRSMNLRPGMHTSQPFGGASYGPAWAR